MALSSPVLGTALGGHDLDSQGQRLRQKDQSHPTREELCNISYNSQLHAIHVHVHVHVHV